MALTIEIDHAHARRLSEHEWEVISPMLPNKPRGIHALTTASRDLIRTVLQ
jgi:transposase